jgi:two-component system OmpR family response regulator
VQTADTGRAALDAVAQRHPALVVLDVMLPDLDGFEIARKLRERGEAVSILFLTARDTTDDKIRGLTLGGDDYVTKPFSIGELVARIHAVLRRTGTTAGTDSRLRLDDLVLDEESHEVWRGDRPIELTATEFRLLRYLLLNPRRVLTRAQILDHVWDYGFSGDARVLETYISYLRKKVDRDGPALIQTVRGVGYVLRAPRGDGR